ncbi:MAG: DUF4383 domain-containing protein [Candidatus Eremiobacteraeota bacterium]|nr:DUF4383 domain-containing protein [Candidatus Eremiobacteraeota bacterium]
MVRRFAQVFGAMYLLVGIAGFIPGLSQMTDGYGAGGGLLLGLFPVNYLLDVVHLTIGAWGVASAGSLTRATTYARVVGAVFIALGIYGICAVANGGHLPTDALVPLNGNDWWLHLTSGLLAAYFGWGVRASSVA